MIFIRKQGEGEGEFSRKLLVRTERTGAHSENDRLFRVKRGQLVAKITRFRRSAGGVVARIKVQHDVLRSLELSEADGLCGSGRQIEGGRPIADLRHCPIQHGAVSCEESMRTALWPLAGKGPKHNMLDRAFHFHFGGWPF